MPIGSVVLLGFGSPGSIVTLGFGGAAAPVPELLAAIRSHLLADSRIASLVGDRFRAGWLKQNEPVPAIRVAVLSSERVYALSDVLGVAVSLVQIDVWGASALQCCELRALVADNLHFFSGLMGGLQVSESRELDAAGRILDPADGSGRFVDRLAVDYRIRHQIAIPQRP